MNFMQSDHSNPNQQALPRVMVSPGVEIAYQIDDYCDGWTQADTVVMLHGIAETGDAFRAWVPHFARQFRVIRIDLRGYGQSSGVAEDERLSIAQLADDVLGLIEELQPRLQLGRVHLIGAKLGAQIGLELAQRRPPWLASLTLAGVLIAPGKALGQWVEQWIQMVDQGGVRAWAKATMAGRMGASLSTEAFDWWIDYMGTAPASTVKACFRMLPQLAEPTWLEQIACPTMVIVAVEPSPAGDFRQQQSVTEVRRWLGRIPNSAVTELTADSYHVAASHPDQCAAIACAFIESQ